jgi:hypothetical protein
MIPSVPIIASAVLILLGLVAIALGLAAKSSYIDVPHDAPISRRRRIILGVGLALLTGGVIWIVGQGIEASRLPEASNSMPPVNLVGIRYMADGWNPRLVDLRTAAEDGIPAIHGGTLQLNSLWVSVPAQSSDSEVQIEIYANGDLIGLSSVHPLASPVTQIDDIQIKGYQDSENPDAWLVQDEWENLDISTIVYSQGKRVGSSKTPIRLRPGGMSWLISPPSASLVSISYAVNDGAEKVLDLRELNTGGLNVTQNDKLDLRAIWYAANADGAGQRLWVEAYLTAEGYPSGKVKTNNDNSDLIQKGFHALSSVSSLSWIVPADVNWLMMTLVRSDQTVLERINIPLNAQSDPGLVAASESVLWPFAQVEYLDFENKSDFNGWSGVGQNTVAQSHANHFSGEGSLAVTVGSDQTQLFVERDSHFRAEALVGQVYWPQQDGIDVQWAQVCVTPSFSCFSIPKEPGRWNTFMVDLSGTEYNGDKLNRIQLSSFFIQGKVIGANSDQPYTFYVDGIQIYPANLP